MSLKKVFSKVFSISLLATLAKFAITVASNIYLGSKGYNVSQDMFNKAMYTSSGNISKYTQDLIRQKSQNSQQVETAIKSCISQNGGTNSFSNCLGYDDAEMSGDLFYSIQHVDIYVSGKKINNDTWHITITMEDIYDFEKREWNSFANYINNLGYYMQETDMLRSYYWSISYDMIYKE